jgi:hypothetical protein
MTIRELARDEQDLHEDLTHIHEALSAAYSEILADPRHHAEGLDRAACGPHLTHLAALATAAAAGGVSATGWRTDVLTQVGPSATGPLDRAETCMRQSGLWPWNP